MQGIGVVLAETRQAAGKRIDASRPERPYSAQEHVREAQAATCAAWWAVAVAAIERQAKPGEFRSNLHRMRARKVTITARSG